jgi:hypothetical protein
MLGEFSLPAPLWYVSRGGGGGGGGAAHGARLARVVGWLLQRRLLLQLHTYVQFNSPHWHWGLDTGTGFSLLTPIHTYMYIFSCGFADKIKE